MTDMFVHPGFLWLAPLITAPIIIHLLNRIRYRRQRWAAMEFLLTSERRAVRRAKLQQILLMILRMLLLAFALGALAQPIFGGRIAALLGGSTQVAIVVDASASMSASGAGGTAYKHAQDLAVESLAGISRKAGVAAATFSADYRSEFAEPVINRDVVRGAIESAPRTDGPGNIPQALQAAARALGRAGTGGAIWMLTDMQADGWHADDEGAWQRVRAALHEAGKPRVIITDVSPQPTFNLAVADVRLSKPVVVEGDEPRIIATVRRYGEVHGNVLLSAYFDGKFLERKVVDFGDAETVPVHFQLPQLTGGAHAGNVHLHRARVEGETEARAADSVPADDRYHFVVHTETRLPVLIVDGAPSNVLFDGASDFVALALAPPESEMTGRSPYTVKTIEAGALGEEALADYPAVVLADVERLEPDAVNQIDEYIRGGGLAAFFCGPRTDVGAWNGNELLGVRLKRSVLAPPEQAFLAQLTPPLRPVVASLDTEGLSTVRINSMFEMEAGPETQELIGTDAGYPILVARQIGKGRVYVFAVSAKDREDDEELSNLPLTPVLLLTLHRAVQMHLVEMGGRLSQVVPTELRVQLPGALRHISTPDGQVVALPPREDLTSDVVFTQTSLAGVYSAVPMSPGPGGEDPDSVPLAALNVPVAESELERIDQDLIYRRLLAGHSVTIQAATGNGQDLKGGERSESAATSFPFAALAMLFLLGEVMLAWSMRRPAASDEDEESASSR